MFKSKSFRNSIISLAVLLIAALIFTFFSGKNEPEKVTNKPANSPVSASTKAPASVFSFKTDKALTDHFKKHGIEMGFSSKEEYVAAANDVINNPDSLCKTEKEDGDFVYYLESENYIVFLSQKGVIRSFFAPSDGISYFNRQ